MRAAFGDIADYIATQRAAILETWHLMVEADPRLLMASQLKRAEFYDHIPKILDTFEATLRSLEDVNVASSEYSRTATATSHEQEAEQHDRAREHGLHRWQQGYRLNEVAREWSHLHECMMDILDGYKVRDEVSHAALAGAQRMLVRLFHDSLTTSIERYDHLQRRDAEGRLADLENAVAELGASERERGVALREASHDLRGSLSVVRGAASLLTRSDLPPESRDETHDLLQRGVDSLHSMLTDLMDLARLEANQETLNVAVFDAADGLRELCDVLQPLAKTRGLYLRAEGPESLQVHGDATKVQRIAQNLILNALKYTREGGVVVRWEEHDEKRWRFYVSDSGPGLQDASTPIARDLQAASTSARKADADSAAMPEAPHTPSAQSASTRVPASGASHKPVKNSGDESQTGEGIGLSIVKRLCELLDITLEVKAGDGPPPGGGTTFCVIVPRAYNSAIRVQKNEEIVPAPAH